MQRLHTEDAVGFRLDDSVPLADVMGGLLRSYPCDPP